jgi:TonB family protein
VSSKYAATLLAALLMSILPIAAFGQAALTSRQITERLSEWDQAYARLKREIWNLQRGSSMFGRDLRGRTLSDDLRDFVLIPSAEKRIEEQRALITTQIGKGDTQHLTENLVSLYGNLRNEIETLGRIGEHRVRYQHFVRQRALWQQRVSAIPNYQVPGAIRDLEQRAVEQLDTGHFEQARGIYGELLPAYGAELERLMQSGVKLGRTSSEDIVYERRTPCGDEAKVNPSKALPSLSSKTAPDYPAASRAEGEEGTVYVQLLVSGGGCALRYAIQLSSGWLDLDQASLEWVETLKFIPAAKDRKAIEAWVTLPVVFRLN